MPFTLLVLALALSPNWYWTGGIVVAWTVDMALDALSARREARSNEA